MPVLDPWVQDAPGYYEAIAEPMDLSTVLYKLDSNQYENPDQVCGAV